MSKFEKINLYCLESEIEMNEYEVQLRTSSDDWEFRLLGLIKFLKHYNNLDKLLVLLYLSKHKNTRESAVK
jgi:hypothetical protein